MTYEFGESPNLSELMGSANKINFNISDTLKQKQQWTIDAYLLAQLHVRVQNTSPQPLEKQYHTCSFQGYPLCLGIGNESEWIQGHTRGV